jgi:hypothetical protein
MAHERRASQRTCAGRRVPAAGECQAPTWPARAAAASRRATAMPTAVMPGARQLLVSDPVLAVRPAAVLPAASSSRSQASSVRPRATYRHRAGVRPASRGDPRPAARSAPGGARTQTPVDHLENREVGLRVQLGQAHAQVRAWACAAVKPSRASPRAPAQSCPTPRLLNPTVRNAEWRAAADAVPSRPGSAAAGWTTRPGRRRPCSGRTPSSWRQSGSRRGSAGPRRCRKELGGGLRVPVHGGKRWW